MNRVFRRSFCTAKTQLGRHGIIAFNKSTIVMGMFLGGGAGAVVAGTVFLQSSEINSLGVKIIEQTAAFKDSQAEVKKLTNTMNREKTQFEATVAEKEGVIAEKEDVISEKENALADAKSTIDTKVEALNAQDFVLTQTKAKLHETSQQHSKLNRRYKDLKTIKTKLTGDLTNCVKTRETHVERLTREKTELKNSYQALNKRANNLETVIGGLRDELRMSNIKAM